MSEKRKVQQPKTQCNKCGRFITNANFKKHSNSCDGIIKNYASKYDYISNLICPFCDCKKETRNSLIQHIVRCPKNPDRKDWDKLGKYSTKNRRGQTKETNNNIALVTQKLVESYKNGTRKSQLTHGTVTSIYKDHNDQEIAKYLSYISTLSETLPKYNKINSNTGYVLVSDIKSDLKYSIKFEHELICSINLKIENIAKYTIHHIDHVRYNNTIENLMVFNSRREHLQFHRSEYSWLIYNPETHIFSVEIIKIES